jgi:hypothetical protein
VFGPGAQPVSVDPVDVVAVAPGSGVAGEGPVGDHDGDVGSVDGAGSSFDLIHDVGADFGPDGGVLGLDDDPAVLRLLADDVGGLVSLLTDAAGAPTVPDEEVSQCELEFLIVHGIDLGEDKLQPGKALGLQLSGTSGSCEAQRRVACACCRKQDE